MWCGRCSSRSSRSRAGKRSATRRWRASRASPACRPRGGSRRRTGSGSGPRSRRSPCGRRRGGPARPGTFLSVNLSPSALASSRGPRPARGDLRGIVIEITEEERVLDVEGAAARPRPAASARRAHRRRRRRRGLRRPPAGDEHARRHHQARPRARGRRPRRPRQGGADRLAGALRAQHGASICAEGIETLEELRVLIHLGVAYGQGWTLGGPPGLAARERRGGAAVPRAALERAQDRALPRAAALGGPDGDADHAGDARPARRRCSSAPPRCATRATCTQVLEDVARAISEVLGYRAVVVNIYRAAFDDLLTAAAVGSDDSLQQLSGRSRPSTPGRRCSPSASGAARTPTSCPTASSTGTRSGSTPRCPISSRATTRTPGCPATRCSCRCATPATSCWA